MLKIIKAKISIARQITSIFLKNKRTFSWSYVVYFQKIKMIPYCNSAEVTKEMQVTIHVEIDVKDFVLGVAEVIVLKIFIKHKNKVISKAIRPGMISCGIAKLI